MFVYYKKSCFKTSSIISTKIPKLPSSQAKGTTQFKNLTRKQNANLQTIDTSYNVIRAYGVRLWGFHKKL